jgi:para-aminobenzoate synthetase/4-amino-4-deoxychorismate lyase
VPLNEPKTLLQRGREWTRYLDLDARLECARAADVPTLLEDLERATERGFHVVGYLSYDAASGLGLPARDRDPDAPPLASFGLFRRCEPAAPPRPDWNAVVPRLDWRPGIDRRRYVRAVERIHDHLAAGDTYQVNFTFPLVSEFDQDPGELFARLVAVMRPRHAAYLDLGRHVVVSASPELFFSLEGDRLAARPMKGTLGRAPTPETDRERARRLRDSEKDRAENVMIVDMLRNDLGRIAEIGSVAVESLFEVETYPTLHQLTSTVTARSRAPLSRILSALFPCASITGAPKRGSMELIAALETGPRGVYTGAVGYLGPGRRASLSVAIRTAVVDRQLRQARYGVGSGIVADSVAQDEYQECLLKARVLEERPFRLLETLRWSPGEGYRLIDEHLDRLERSGRYFAADPGLRESARRALAENATSLTDASRVRLLADLDGRLEIQSTPLEESGDPPPSRVAFATRPIAASAPWLYHKTTRRELYDRALAERPDCDDVLLWNERGELTESTRANVVVELPEGRFTPPVECGLLPGTLRSRLLVEGRLRERRMRVGEIAGRRLLLVNSVQGWSEARLVGPAPEVSVVPARL